MPRGIGKEVTQGYAAHPLPPNLTLATSSLRHPHFLVGAIKPMVSPSVDATDGSDWWCEHPVQEAVRSLRVHGEYLPIPDGRDRLR